MAEYVRSVRVGVEVDTNKKTYRLVIDDADSPEEAGARVTEFIREVSGG